MKITSADKFMCWLAVSLFALIFCWYKEPKLTDFLCTAMSIVNFQRFSTPYPEVA